MSISTEERTIIERILDHSAAGTTDELPEIAMHPVTNYTDPDQLGREIKTLFRNFPLIIGHRSDVAEPGDFLTHDETGVPILVTRDQEGKVRAYLNVCRHRGARLQSEPCGQTRTFTCPYHAWTYGLDGSLRGVPQPHGFKGIDRSKMGLVELPAFEQFGLIWVVPSVQKEDIDFATWVAPMAEQLAGLNLGEHHVFKKWSLDRKMSWRFALEGFQESYHFCTAHKTTACSAYLDNQSVHISHYPHVRHAVPLPQVENLRGQQPEDWDYRANFMTQNYLFPANFVQVQTDHVYIHTIIPTGPGTCVFQCMMLISEAPKTEKAERYWSKNYSLIRKVFEEDFKIGEGIQKGIDTGANENFVFGTYECGLHYGKKAIEDALSGRLTV